MGWAGAVRHTGKTKGPRKGSLRCNLLKASQVASADADVEGAEVKPQSPVKAMAHRTPAARLIEPR